jgi:hypothetical protein
MTSQIIYQESGKSNLNPIFIGLLPVYNRSRFYNAISFDYLKKAFSSLRAELSCRGAEQVRLRAEDSSLRADLVCLIADNFCRGAETFCLRAEHPCRGAETFCLRAEHPCRGAETFCLRAEHVFSIEKI